MCPAHSREDALQTILLEAIVEALSAVTTRRFFRSERGYQGRFYCSLWAILDRHGFLADDLVLEIEYQKAARHQMTQRPDIILHVPAEESGARPDENNFLVVALKRQASRAQTLDDFQKLDEMCGRLRYPLAVFINIDSDEHHLEHYTGPFAERLHAFAVRCNRATLHIRHAWCEDGTVQEKEE